MKPIEIETDRERLLIAIHRTGLPNWRVAQGADMNPPDLSQFLSGARVPSRAACKALARAVKVPVEHLFPDRLGELSAPRSGT